MTTTTHPNPMQLLHLLLDRATPKTFERALVRARASTHILHSEWRPGAQGKFGTLEARVSGSSAASYRVKVDFGRRTWSCTCPSVARWRRQGACCKHVAALSVAMLRRPSSFPDERARFWMRTHPERVHADQAHKLEGIIWHTSVPDDHTLLEGVVTASTARALGVRLATSRDVLWIPRPLAVGVRCAHTRGMFRVQLALPSWWVERHQPRSCRSRHAM